jgi:hypothetical protein
MFDPIPSSLGHIREGRLRALAVTTSTRSDALPDVPSVAEFIPGYDTSFWCGISAPKNTAGEIVDKLNMEINTILVDPKTKARFADLNATALLRSPAEFGKLIADETEKWGKVIRTANIKGGVIEVLHREISSPKLIGTRNETSTPSISASGSGCCRSPGCIADCKGAGGLSDAAGPHNRALRARRRNGLRGSCDRRIPIPWHGPTGDHREQVRWEFNDRHRDGS